MKKKQLIKKLNNMGCNLIRHDSNHDWYQNPGTKACQPVPRHTEINEQLAKKILKALSND